MSGLILPAFSAASIIATAMRSLTLCAGLKYSSFNAIVAWVVFRRLSLTSGVLPISSMMLLAICMASLLILDLFYRL